MTEPERPKDGLRQIGPWGWFAIVALVGLLSAACWYCVDAWTEVPGVGIPPIGWFFLILGVVVTFVVGAGLMALLFYSSRKGRDF